MFSLKLPVGRLEATVTVFGPKDAERHNLTSWSLKGLQHQSDVSQNGPLVSALAKELSKLDVSEVFAPNVAAASAIVVNAMELKDEIFLGESLLHRNQFLPADGVTLQTDQASMTGAGGCGIIIASASSLKFATVNEMIVAHAGRPSLIDKGAVDGKTPRKHFSVVNAIIEKFVRRGASITDIVMIMLFSIPAKEFEHNLKNPEWGAYNRKLVAYIEARWPGGIFRPTFDKNAAYLDLEQVFVGQAKQAGVRKAWATHSLAEYPDLVHTCVGENANKRNLYIVKRT